MLPCPNSSTCCSRTLTAWLGLCGLVQCFRDGEAILQEILTKLLFNKLRLARARAAEDWLYGHRYGAICSLPPSLRR